MNSICDTLFFFNYRISGIMRGLRRLDAVLKPIKQAVLDQRGITNQDKALHEAMNLLATKESVVPPMSYELDEEASVVLSGGEAGAKDSAIRGAPIDISVTVPLKQQAMNQPDESRQPCRERDVDKPTRDKQ
jgi:hypothetical protein